MVSSVKMYRIHVSVIRAQGQCPNFMLSLEEYTFNSGYILTYIKENAQSTCPWPFMVPVIGLKYSALSNQRHAWLPFHLCPLKQYFSHAMIMDGWLKN